MRYFSLLFILFAATVVIAQPSNNDCNGVIDLGTAPACPEDIFTNIDATPYDIVYENEPPCFTENPPQNDVWFSFFTAPGETNYTVTITGQANGPNPAIKNIQLAIYRGFCEPDGLSLNDCIISAFGEEEVSIDLTNLTPGDIYYARVDNYGGDQYEGDFKVCVEIKDPEVNITEGFSDACSGILYDSGGPDGNYSENENYEFTICPSEFHQCIYFTLQYFNLEDGGFGFGDEMTFFNGPDVNSPQVGTISGNAGFGEYGGGGVCYAVHADSCLTIQFISDGSTSFEGFEGFWECSLDNCEDFETITVNDNVSDEDIEIAITSALAEVTVDTVICTNGAYGTFLSGDNSDLGLKKGLLLTSGDPNLVVGPNSQTGATGFNGAPGDADLDVLSTLNGNGTLSNDACVVEVDVFVYTNELKFEYIFGSEEYPEFVNSSFNDIFALLISGPGITGIPGLNGQDNLAILPDGTPIQINSVNNDTNWEYYRNNGAGQSVEYDGLTADFKGIKKSLTATADVIPCNTYHLKFAVADRGDFSLDSGVFIAEISSGVPNLEVAFESGVNYFVEKCSGSNDILIIELNEALEQDITYDVEISGTADLGTDYILDIPDSITFEAGQTILTFPIIPLDDDIIEGTETIIITLMNDFGCGTIPVTTIEIELRDRAYVEVEAGQDTVLACKGAPLQLNAEGANNYKWKPVSKVDDPFISNPNVQTEESTWFYVEGSIEPFTVEECKDIDSVYVMVIDPQIEIQTTDDLNICFGDTIHVTVVNNVDNNGLSWTPANFGVIDPDSTETDIIPPFASTFPFQYIASVELAGCEVFDTINVLVDAFDFPTVTTLDTAICEGYSLVLANPIFFTSTTYEWLPDLYLDDNTIANATSTPEEEITYTLIATSATGSCVDSVSVHIDVIPNQVDILNEDPVLLCLGDSILLQTTSSSSGLSLEWSPDDFIDNPIGSEVWVKPDDSGWIYVALDTNGCMSYDSIFIQVDSLPFLGIEATPQREIYCKGETVTLTSPGYISNDFPNIEHEWQPGPGFISEGDNYNLAISTVDTFTYVRITQNGACYEEQEYKINVIDPNLFLSITDTIVCPGEPVQVFLTSDEEIEDISWSPGVQSNLISCDDCTDPIISIGLPQTFTVQATAQGCPTETEIFVDIYGKWGLGIVSTPSIIDPFPVGEEVTFTVTTDLDPGPDATYEWFIGEVTYDETGAEKEVNYKPLDLFGTSITVKHDDLGKWRYKVLLIDEFGCDQFTTIDLNAVHPTFTFPDAFTPDNNDELNDNFRLLITQYDQFSNYTFDHFYIYNRWGEKVFDCEDIECAFEGWDGRYKDQKSPSDMYTYYFQVTILNGDVVSSKKNPGPFWEDGKDFSELKEMYKMTGAFTLIR